MAFNQPTIPQSAPPVPVNQGDAAGGCLLGSTFPNPQLAPGSVGTANLQPNSVDASKIQAGSIGAALLAPGFNFLPVTDPSQINSGVIVDANISAVAQIQTIKLAEGLRFLNDYSDVIASGVKNFWHGTTARKPQDNFDLVNKQYVDYAVISGISSGGGGGGGGGSITAPSAISIENTSGYGIIPSSPSFIDLTFNQNNVVIGLDISHSTSSNPTQIIINKTASYMCAYTVWARDYFAYFNAQLLQNGTLIPGSLTFSNQANDGAGGNSAQPIINTTVPFNATAGDIIKLQAQEIFAANGYYCRLNMWELTTIGSTLLISGTGNISGLGTTGFLTKFIGISGIGNSVLQEVAGNIIINGNLLSNIGSISGNDIIANSILQGHMANLSIGNPQLQPASVSGNDIAANSILNGHLGLNIIASNNMQSASVSGGTIATQSLLNGMYAPNSIDNSKLQSASISGNVIAQPAFGAPSIAGYPNNAGLFLNGQGGWVSVTGLANQAVSGNNIAQPGIQEGNVLSGYVDLSTNQTVSGTKLWLNSQLFLAPLFGTNIITNPNIALNTIANNQLQSASVSGGVIATQSLLNGMYGKNSIDNTILQSASISGGVIATGAILTGHIGPNVLTNAQHQSASISGGVIATQSLLNGMYAPNSIDNSKLQSASISGTVIATQSILNGMIAPNSIDNTKLQSASISGTAIAQPAFGAPSIAGYPNNPNLFLNGQGGWTTLSAGGLANQAVSGNNVAQPGIQEGNVLSGYVDLFTNQSVSGVKIHFNPIFLGSTNGSLWTTDQNGSLELGGTASGIPQTGGQKPYLIFHFGGGVLKTYDAEIINDANNQLTIKTGSGTALSINPTAATFSVPLAGANIIPTSTIQVGAISGNVIGFGAILNGDIALNAIANNQLQSASVSGGATQSILNGMYAPNSIDNSKLQSASISGGAIATQSLLNGMYAPNSIDNSKLQSASISGGVIGNGVILTGHIGNNVLTNAQHQSASISGGVIAANSILEGHLSPNSIKNSYLESASVSGSNIAQPAIAGPNISGFPNNILLFYNGIGGWSVPQTLINPNSISNSALQSASISGGVIATQSILNGMYAPNSIDNSKLQSASISGGVIGNGVILTGMIGNNVLTNSQHQSASVSGNAISADTVTFLKGSAASGKSNSDTINQPGHGFSAGNAIMYSGIGTGVSAGWMKARADTAYNAEVLGIVQSVTDANNFVVVYEGHITNLSGINAGGVYFLDDVIPGNLVSSPPTTIGHIVKPLIVGISGIGIVAGQEAIVINGPGIVIGSGIQIVNGTANFIAMNNGLSQLVNSVIFQTGGNLGINTQTPLQALDVSGNLNVSGIEYVNGLNVNGQINLNGKIICNNGAISGNDIIANSILQGHMAAGSIGNAQLQGASISGNAVAANAIQVNQLTLFAQSANRNLIINGNFNIWQRLSGSAINVNGGGNFAYVPDRFAFKLANPAWNIIQDNGILPNDGAQTSLKVAVKNPAATSGTELSAIRYVVEGYDLIYMNNQTCTLSFWVYTNCPGTYCVALHNGLSEGASSASYLMNFTVNAANTWQKFVLTFKHDKTQTWNYNTNGGLWIYFTLAAGATQLGNQVNTWLTGGVGASYATASGMGIIGGANNNGFNYGNGNYFNLSQVQLEVGDAPTPFELVHYQQDFAKCQRYCYVINGTKINSMIGQGNMVYATDCTATIFFPVPLRITNVPPTFAGIVGHVTVGNASASSVVTTTIANTSFNNNCNTATCDFTAAGLAGVAQNTPGYVYWNTSATSADMLIFNADY